MADQQTFDWNQGAFQLANTGIGGFFAYKTAEAQADAIKKAPPASVGFLVIGALGLMAILVFAIKR